MALSLLDSLIQEVSSLSMSSSSSTSAPCSRSGPRPLPPEIEAVREQWDAEQTELCKRLITRDERLPSWPGSESKGPPLTLVGGVDISFVGNEEEDACAALVVLSYPELKVVHEKYVMVKLTRPYVSGYLAFREVGFLVELLEDVKRTRPEIMPQIVFVDGNGVLHPRGFGLACHLGVLCDIPTLGVGKKLLNVDGLNKNDVNKLCKDNLLKGGDWVRLQGESGRVWAAALRSTDEAFKQIFVSVGHRMSLESAVDLCKKMTLYRVPEPIRKADLGSREVIRRLEQVA